MKKISMFLCTGVLVSALCMACNNEPTEKTDPWLGQEIPGMEIRQAAGIVIGGYSNGFASLLVQIDEEYPIGKTIEYFDAMPCTDLSTDGTYHNMIQVQGGMPVKIGSMILFSFREYDARKDVDLFQWGAGNMLCAKPDAPIYVITEYKIRNN